MINGYMILEELVGMTIKDLDIELKDYRGSDHGKEVIERVLNQLNSMKKIIQEAKQTESNNKQSNNDK
jgi:DNA-binding PadR family transcriptional regulator